LGQDFLPGTAAAVTVNGYTFEGEIPVGPDGSFSLLIDTVLADEGDYFLSAGYILEAMTIFHLSPDAPLLPPEGTGTLLSLPPGIGLGERAYLPVGTR
jgi:hypothetical protein